MIQPSQYPKFKLRTNRFTERLTAARELDVRKNAPCACGTIELHLGMPTKESYVRARVDDRLKRESEQIFEALGLTTTEAIRIFLHQVRLQKGLPFELRLKEDDSDILLPFAMRRAALDSVYDD